MNHVAYIGLGSNLGDRAQNCRSAVLKLGQSGAKVLSVSVLRESEALTVRGESQPAYINGAVKISTNLNPRELLKALKNIERDLGRETNAKKWAARTIDLDILFFDDAVMDDEDLKIPHPEIQKRGFVLEPLCDIEPGLVHPVLGRSVGELYRELS